MTDRSIYKYAVDPDGRTPMPKGAKIISAGIQNNNIVVWAIVNPDQPMIERTIRVVATGSHPRDGVFVGTVGPVDGWMWFHLFDEGEA